MKERKWNVKELSDSEGQTRIYQVLGKRKYNIIGIQKEWEGIKLAAEEILGKK